jgi:hypothetical protein
MSRTLHNLTQHLWVAPLVQWDAPPVDLAGRTLFAYAGRINTQDGLDALHAALNSTVGGGYRSCRVVGGMVCVVGWWPTPAPERN